MEQGSGQISLNKDALKEVVRRLNIFLEETDEQLRTLDRTVANAETDGWNDMYYHEFYEQYSDTALIIRNELKKIEEEILPNLRRLERSADEFMQH